MIYLLAFLMAVEDEIKRCKLEKIYIQYYKELFITAYSILKDYQEAEDMVQNVVIKLSNNLDKISEIKCKKTRSYLVIIIRNLCYDAYNHKKGIIYLSENEIKKIPVNMGIGMEEYILGIEKSEKIAKLLSEIHQPYADILTLRFFHQLSINEISELLDITCDNVSVRIHRALNALENVIRKEGETVEQMV